MKSLSAAIVLLAGVICFSVGALIPSPGPQVTLTENGLQFGGAPPMVTTGGILMIAGALLAVIGLIVWIVAFRSTHD
jgi:hypothetical protein